MKKKILVGLPMALSGTACTVLWMETKFLSSYWITALCAFLILAGLCIATPFLEKLFATRKKGIWALAGVLTLSSLYTAKSSFFAVTFAWMNDFLDSVNLPMEHLIMRGLPWGLSLLAIPMLLGYYLWVLELLWGLGCRVWKDSDFAEQLFMLGAGCIFGMLIVFTYLCTQGFYGAEVNGWNFGFDLIYSADSGYLVELDVWRNVGAEQNDLRQPLFGLFAMPLAQMAWLVSRVLFFMPRSYLIVSQIFQMVLYLTALILLGRMLELKPMEKTMFLLLMCVSYPVSIFSLTAEQYLFAVSWLLLIIYLKGEPVAQSYAFTAATGSLLTTGILFPLVTWDRDFRKFVKNTFILFFVFVGAVVLSGRLTTFLDIPSYIEGYEPYTGADVLPMDKLRQYVNFVQACVMVPPSGPDFTTYQHASWQMLPVTGWNLVGLAILALALLGVGLNWKRRIVKVAGFWMLYSFVMLGVVGWGTVDNGLLLYTLYFGWAYVTPIFLLLRRALNRWPKVWIGSLLVLVGILCVYNMDGLRKILAFTTQFFPVVG